jgi:hypothetical protein
MNAAGNSRSARAAQPSQAPDTVQARVSPLLSAILCPLCDQPVPQEHVSRVAKAHLRCVRRLPAKAREAFLRDWRAGLHEQAVWNARTAWSQELQRRGLRAGMEDALTDQRRGRQRSVTAGEVCAIAVARRAENTSVPSQTPQRPQERTEP